MTTPDPDTEEIPMTAPHPHRYDPPNLNPPRNGFGIAGLVLALVGLVFCLTPLTGWIGLILGLLAVLFAALGLGRVRKGYATNKKMCIAGLVLGLLTIIAGFFAMKLFFDALSDLGGSTTPPAAVTGPADDRAAAPAEQPIDFAAGQAVNRDGLQIAAAPLVKSKNVMGKVVCSKITYKNAGTEEHTFNPFDWKIQTPAGVQETATYADKNALNSGSLAPGGTVTGNICIKDPALKGDYLIINDAVWEDTIRWKTGL